MAATPTDSGCFVGASNEVARWVRSFCGVLRCDASTRSRNAQPSLQADNCVTRADAHRTMLPLQPSHANLSDL